MSGRTYWLMKDASWYTRDEVRRATRKFGPVGPAVMDWLECAAKRENVGGRLKAGAFTIADEIGADEVTVCHVVSHLVTRKWLVSHDVDGTLFKTTIAWFRVDQTRGSDAERQAKSRANQPDSDSLSRSVTGSHLRVEESRDNERAKALSPRVVRTEAEKASDDDRASCRLFYSLGRDRNPKLKVPREGSKEQAAAFRSMRLLREQDAQQPADVQRLIQWLFTDSSDDAQFWGTTIQAPSGLRKNFSAAWSKMAAPTVVAISSRPSAVSELHRKLNEAEQARKGAA